MIRSLRLGAILLLTAVLIGGAYTGYCYHRDRTPEAALRHIARAVMTEDRELFDQYVDEEAVLSSMYADVSTLLAEHITELHERHPSDWFFRHDSAFMRTYMAQHSAEYIGFAHSLLDFYFAVGLGRGACLCCALYGQHRARRDRGRPRTCHLSCARR